MPEVLPLATSLLLGEDGLLGCCLRYVLEAHETADGFVEDALKRAVERGHRACAELAYILSGMTRSQRARVGEQAFRRAEHCRKQELAARREPYERHAKMCRRCQPCRPCTIGRYHLTAGGFAV